MLKRRLVSMVLVLCLLFTTVAFCIGSVLGAVTASGIEYNESRLHTMEDGVADAYIPGAYDQWIDSGNGGDSAGVDTPGAWWPEDYTETTDGFVTDSDANHGTVLKLNGSYNSHFGFEDFDVKKDRKYYIYFDAKSETAGAQGVTLIGVNNYSSSVSRIFFSGQSNRDTGVQFYVDGAKVNSQSFKYTKSWQRYGIVIDTSNEALLADIANVNGANFWSNDIHFQLGALDATVYFDNIQLIEIQSLPDAVADETSLSASASVRFPKTAAENNGSYLSAGLRFMGIISDEVKSTADEIGFVITPSVSAISDPEWYDMSNGVKSIARSAPCYIKGEMDVVYSKFFEGTGYQLILTGLSTSSGKTAYIQRYSAAMYVKTGDTYSYYALGETSFNEVCAKYYTFNIKSGHINTGIELVLNGVTQKSSLTVGDQLPTLSSHLSDAPSRHGFLGWYDEDLNLHTTVPNNVDKLYGRYEGYSAHTFDTGAIYNPNNKNYISAVDDPFGGEGKVLYSPLTGNIRGVVPTAVDGISSTAFEIEKDHTYKIRFKYRYAESDPESATCTLEVYGVSDAGVYLNENKTKIVYPDFIPQSNGKLNNTGDWAETTFTVTNVTEHPYLYIRFLVTNSSAAYNLYVDDLSICDLTTYKSGTEIKLVDGGNVETTDLAVGDPLPTLNGYYDSITKSTYEFDGWYDEALTTKYTVVDEAVTIYYAKYNSLTSLSFEVGGLYDPNHKYNSTTGSISSWYRTPDPTGADNICLMANLSKNGNNTHFAPSFVEGTDIGYTLTEGNKYVLKFDYYLSTNNPIVVGQDVGIRGSAQSNIGISKNKTESMGSYNLSALNNWDDCSLIFTASSEVASYPYLIFMCQSEYYANEAQTQRISDYYLYIDNLKIIELSADSDVVIYTEAKNVTLNDNGEVEIYNNFVVGSDIPSPKTYEGANFIGWYNETLNVPYKTIQGKDTTLFAKFDASVITFENGVMYDPNSIFANDTRVKITTDPTNAENSVMMIDLNGSVGNHHFAVCESAYSSNGYKLTIGNTYTITFKYYADNLNSNGVSLQFRGCKQDNIGLTGGKSSGYGNTKVSVEKQWTTVSVTFTYKGAGLTDEANPYLLVLAQDGSQASGASACTATVYLDDIVIKESTPEKTYTKKTVKVNGWTLGYSGRPHNIVVPRAGFSYLAMMQLEELVTTIKNTTTTACEFNIVYEDDWTEASNQFNIFVGDVTGHSRDKAKYKIDASGFAYDDYAISYGSGNIYIDAGSTYALAMAISELNKTLGNPSITTLSGTVTGKYSENIDSYSSESYYRPAFLEDFDGTEINKNVWNEINGRVITSALDGWKSMRSDEHTYVEDGNLVINAAYNEDEKMFYGGMLESHGKMEYRYGYLEVRCITPNGRGLWTATWATPSTASSGFYRSEIDLNESFGDATYSAFNMHSWLTSAGSNMAYQKYSLDQVKGCSAKKANAGTTAGFNDGFHTFGYLWTENSAKFIVDGKVQFEYNYDDTHSTSMFNGSITNNDYDAFNEKLSLIVSMTVGNGGASYQDPTIGADYWTTSNKYIVDYVHIYQIDGQEIYFTPPVE